MTEERRSLSDTWQPIKNYGAYLVMGYAISGLATMPLTCSLTYMTLRGRLRREILPKFVEKRLRTSSTSSTRRRTSSVSKVSIDQLSSLSAPRALAVSVGLTLVSPLNYIFLPFHIAVAFTFFFIGKDYIDPYIEKYPFMKAILANN